VLRKTGVPPRTSGSFPITWSPRFKLGALWAGCPQHQFTLGGKSRGSATAATEVIRRASGVGLGLIRLWTIGLLAPVWELDERRDSH